MTSTVRGASNAKLCKRLREAGGPLCIEAAERIEGILSSLRPHPDEIKWACQIIRRAANGRFDRVRMSEEAEAEA